MLIRFDNMRAAMLIASPLGKTEQPKWTPEREGRRLFKAIRRWNSTIYFFSAADADKARGHLDSMPTWGAGSYALYDVTPEVVIFPSRGKAS